MGYFALSNQLFGDIVKETPTSKVVGVLFQFLVSDELSPEDVEWRAGLLNFRDSVLDFFQGMIGSPYGRRNSRINS